MMKKVLSLVLTVVMVMSMSVTAFAAETISVEKNVSYLQNKIEVDIQSPARTINKPSELWNFKNGKYNFAGRSMNDSLYTNYLFNGATKYSVRINNLSPDRELTAKVKIYKTGWDNTIKTVKVSASTTSFFDVETENMNTKIYIQFIGTEMDFDGYITQK